MADEETTQNEEAGAAPEDAEAAAEAAPEAAPEAPPADDVPDVADSPVVSTTPPAVARTPEEIAAEERAAQRAARVKGEVESRPVRAVARYVRFGARKGRLVADQIRGKTILDAATALSFSKRAAAREMLKVLKSAVANAENNHGMSADELFVEAAFVDEGPTLKRWKPRARGRVDRIQKRTCHITVVVNTAPESLLEGRRAGATVRRADRVAASRKAAGSEPERTSGAKKTTSRKPAASKADRSKRVAASKQGEAETTATATKAKPKKAAAPKASKATSTKAAAKKAPAGDDGKTKEQDS